MKKMLAVMLSLVASPAFSQTTQQFDLVCVGEVSRRPMTQVGQYVPWEGRLKVDLVSGAFCQDDCSKVETIHRIEPETLRLGDIKGPPTLDLSRIDRATGTYIRSKLTQTIRGGRLEGLSEDYRGKCTPESFSGFPKKLF